MGIAPELSWLERMLVGRGLRVPEQVPPPAGFSSWGLWFALQGYRVGVDWLPLGPGGDLPSEGRRLNMVWSRLGEDVCTIDLHFVHRDGSSTVPFTDDDSATINAMAVSLWADLKGFYAETFTLDRLIWHEIGVTVRAPNPAKLTTLLGTVSGEGGGEQLPEQCAMSVTFKTDHRRSWGRVYLPAPHVGSLAAAGGNIHADTVDAIRTAFGTLLDDAFAADLPLVVWAPRHEGKLLQYSSVRPRPDSFVLDVPDTTSVARGVNQVQVDDLFDVIRSRRNDKATHFATHTLA